MMERLEESKNMEAAERAKLEDEIRAKQDEVQRIQSEVEIKDQETRRLQVQFFLNMIRFSSRSWILTRIPMPKSYSNA